MADATRENIGLATVRIREGTTIFENFTDLKTLLLSGQISEMEFLERVSGYEAQDQELILSSINSDDMTSLSDISIQNDHNDPAHNSQFLATVRSIPVDEFATNECLVCTQNTAGNIVFSCGHRGTCKECSITCIE